MASQWIDAAPMTGSAKQSSLRRNTHWISSPPAAPRNDGGGSANTDPLIFAGARRRDRQSAVGIFVQLVAQRADRNAQDVRSMGAIAEAMLQRLQNEIAFDVGHRTSDQRAGDLFAGDGGVRRCRHRRGDREPGAVR